MRKGYTLVEIIVIMGLLVIISLPMTHIFRTLVSNIPRRIQVVDTQDNIQLALHQIARDIRHGRTLPLMHEDINSDESTLLIELPEGIACYHIDTDVITRQIITSGESSTGGTQPLNDAIQTRTKYSIIPPAISPDPNDYPGIHETKYEDPNKIPTGNLNREPNDITNSTPILPVPEQCTIAAAGRDRILFNPNPAFMVSNDPNRNERPGKKNKKTVSDKAEWENDDWGSDDGSWQGQTTPDPNKLSDNDPNRVNWNKLYTLFCNELHKYIPIDCNQLKQDNFDGISQFVSSIFGKTYDSPQPIEHVILPDKTTLPKDNIKTWFIPDGQIAFKRLTENGKAYAVAVTSGIEYKFQGANYKKWKNSHVFFLNINKAYLAKDSEANHETNK